MGKRLKRFLSVVLMVVLAIVSLVISPVHADDDYDSLRIKWKDMLTGGSTYDTSDTDIAACVSAITSTAQQLWNSMDTSGGRTYLWSDCANLSTESSHIAMSYDHLKSMTLAYATRGSALQNNTTLRSDIISALDWLYANYYNETKSIYDNWYDWVIAIPLRLNDMTVFLYDNLTGTQKSNYMNAITYFLPEPIYTGANRAWTCVITIIRGIINKSTATISSGRNGLSDIFDYVTSGDGFYTDGSFIQHEKHPYTGGYGLPLLDNLGIALYILDGSTWEVTDNDVENAYAWIYDSYAPVIYKGAVMDMVRGREISRYYTQDHVIGNRAIRLIYKMAETADATDRENFKSMIKYWLQQDTFKNFYSDQPIETIVKVKELMADGSIDPMNEPVFNKVFQNMDRVVHTRPGYGFGISMFSSRIYNFESINDENLKGYHTADGMTYLYNSDLGQYSGDFWCTVDPYKLPGTTVRHNTTETHRSTSPNKAVGGSNILDIYGTAGMAMATPGSTLTAKKSWFMFDDEIVALGAGITCTNAEAIETIVENRKLNASGNNAFTVNGTAKSTSLGWTDNMTGVNWAHLAGSVAGSDIGYYFPGGASLTGLRESRTGKWSTINAYIKAAEPGDPDHTNNFLTMYFNHGTTPANEDYSYVLLPGKTSAQVGSYASAPDISILSNTTTLQAVKENDLNIIGASFWSDSSQTIDIITCNKKASVMTRENAGTDIEVAVSDPGQTNTGTIDIEIDRMASGVISKDARVTVTQLSPTIILSINANGSDGATIKAKFSLEKSTVKIEGEDQTWSSSDSVIYPDYGQASGGYYARINADAAGDYGQFSAYAPAGTYTVKVGIIKSSNGGNFRMKIDDVYQGDEVDTYASEASPAEIDLGIKNISMDGSKLFRFDVTGKNASSGDYDARIDYVKLIPTTLLEGEDQTWSTSDGLLNLDYVEASGGYYTKISADAAGDYGRFNAYVYPGAYIIKVGIIKSSNGGKFRMSLDGAYQGAEVDTYASAASTEEIDLGIKNITVDGGNMPFRFDVTGKNASSGDYDVRIDYMKLVPAILEGEDQTWNSSDGVVYQDYGEASGGYYTRIFADAADDYGQFDVYATAGTYTVKVGIIRSSNGGQFRLVLDGIQSAEVDTYAVEASPLEINLGAISFDTGSSKLFSFDITGKNASSGDYDVRIDYVKLIPN